MNPLDRQSVALLVSIGFATLSPAHAQVGATLYEVSDSLELQAAIVQAVDGDTVLLAPGDYATDVELDSLGITLCGAGDGVRLLGSLTIRDLAVDQRATVANLELGAPSGGLWFASFNEGVVWFSDVVATGGPEGGVLSQSSRFTVQQSDVVVLERCRLRGTAAYEVGGVFGGFVPATAGLYLIESTVWLYDSTVRGGDNWSEGTTGRAGAIVSGASRLLVSNSLIAGSDAPSVAACGGSVGGDGILVDGGTLGLVDRGTVIQGGLGVFSPSGCTFTSGPGQEIAAPPGALKRTSWVGPSPTLELQDSTPLPLEEGTAADLEVTSGPGEIVVLLASVGANRAADLPLGLHLGMPLGVVLGSTDASGSLLASPQGWSFAGVADVLSAGVQVATLDPVSLGLGLSNPLALTLVDALP